MKSGFMWVRLLQMRQQLLIFELRVCQQVIFLRLRLREQAVLFRELLLARIADRAVETVLPLPVDLKTSAVPTDLVLLLLERIDPWLEWPSLLIPQRSQ